MNLTIITAVKNAESTIINLIESLNRQIDKNFHWYIVDGGSTDNTLEIIKSNTLCPFEIFSSQDFSIYHALNIGVKSIKSKYYVVAGSDDFFFDDFVQFVNKLIMDSNADIILGGVQINESISIFPQGRCDWFYGSDVAHSVGTIILKDLHSKFGYYSNRFPVVADKYFIKSAITANSKFIVSNHKFGNYAQSGYSSKYQIDYLCDLFKMQIITGELIFLQLLLLATRIMLCKVRNLIQK